MHSLDWGQVTPEAAKLDTNEFFYVYNHDLSSLEKIDRTLRFIIGRLFYYDHHLPKNATHQIKIDIRGQQISDTTCEYLTKNIKARYYRPESLTITFVK